MEHASLAVNCPHRIVAVSYMENRNIFILQTHDIDEIAAAFGGQNLVAAQLSPGVFEGQLLQVHCDQLQCWRLSWNQKVQLLGNLSADTISLWIPLTMNYRSTWNGFNCHAHQIILNLDQKIDYTHLESSLVACITASRESFLQNLRQQNLQPLREETLNPGVLTPQSAQLQVLRDYLKDIFFLAVSNSELLSQPYLNQTITNHLLSSILELLLSSQGLPEKTGRSLNRTLKLKQAVEYIRKNLDQPLSIQTISSEIGIGQRSLIYSFKESFGMGPMEYCKSNRLNAVRRHLKIANAATHKVTEIARRWGFYHMSHFSADYKSMFGELPSETLQRSH